MDGLSMIYWVVAVTTLMAVEEKSTYIAPRTYVGTDWGYASIFMWLMVLILGLVFFFRSKLAKGDPTIKSTLCLAMVLTIPFIGMCVGYSYHVLYLSQ